MENIDSKENDQTPGVAFPKSKSQPQFEATPSSSRSPSGALKTKNIRDMYVSGKDLPSKSISDLLQKPLKKASPLRQLNSPKGRTSHRKKVLPPTKLHFDHCSDTEDSPKWTVKEIRGCRRSLSMPTESTSYDTSDAPHYGNPKRLKLFAEETSPYEDLVGDENTNPKASTSTNLTPAVKKLFVKAASDSGLMNCKIKSAVELISDNTHLIGDGSKSYILPFKLDGKHPDLKEITCETLASLMESQTGPDSIEFKIIDCRFPYEYEGGHIKGAINLYTKNQIMTELLDSKTTLASPCSRNREKASREVLIFHCEFSSRRGPESCRYLRACDRVHNQSAYPFLFYPELYVLHGGYKEFYSKFPTLCDPQAYVPMDHPDHTDKYRRFKSEAKLGTSGP